MSEAQTVPYLRWSVFSCLCSTQGLDFPVLPSSWKFLELKTCSLELVRVSNTSWDEFWKDKMQYVNLESAWEEALQPRSCYICLQTKLYPLFLASPICLCGAVNSQWMGWDDSLGFGRTPGAAPSISCLSLPPPAPWWHFFTNKAHLS